MVTHPYQAMPPRSSVMSGRIVITASDSKATSVTIATSPTVSARWSAAGSRRGEVAIEPSVTITSELNTSAGRVEIPGVEGAAVLRYVRQPE